MLAETKLIKYSKPRRKHWILQHEDSKRSENLRKTHKLGNITQKIKQYKNNWLRLVKTTEIQPHQHKMYLDEFPTSSCKRTELLS